MITVTQFTFGSFGENTYVLHDDTKACIVIDPGCMQDFERNRLTSFIEAQQLKVEKVVNTHCHIDHVFANKYVKEHYGVKLLIPEGEQEVLGWAEQSASMWGIEGYEHTEADELLPQSGKLTFGASELEIRFVPGHAPGHLAFYSAEQQFVIGGDVLFNGSIGRTDLPGGNFDVLAESIKTQIYTLPEETVVYCGHGPSTTVGAEMRTNPFVRMG